MERVNILCMSWLYRLQTFIEIYEQKVVKILNNEKTHLSSTTIIHVL